MELDDAIRHLGDFSRYQTLVFILITISGTIFPAWQMMAMVFTTDQPAGYRCKTPPSIGGGNGSEYYADVSSNTFRHSDNRTLIEPLDVQECFVNSTQTGDRVACSEWIYYMKYGEKTAVTDLDLVCGRELLGNTAQSIYFAGVLVGSVSAGALSDMFGRKPVLIGALLLEGIFGVCTALVWSYPAFVSLWFFVGVFEQGINITEFVYIMEMFSPEKRTLAGAINGVGWGLGVVLTTPLAYVLRNWRHMHIAISIPNMVAVPLLMWLSCESVRWLVSVGRLERAEKILHRIARINGIEPPERFLTETDSRLIHVVAEDRIKHATPDVNKNAGNSEDDGLMKDNGTTNDISHDDREYPSVRAPSAEKFRLADLRKTPRTIVNAFIMFFSWFVSSMVYFGMSLNSSNLTGDKYLNFFLLAVIEFVGYLGVYFVLEWCGRRPTLSGSHFVAGLSSIICACIPQRPDLSPVIMTFAMIGKLGVTISFCTDFIYGSEIFPTPIRNIGVGLSSFSARLGGILAPFVVYLADVSSYIPLNVFGALSLIAGGMVLMLPETAKKALPETLADGERLARSARLPSSPTCWRSGPTVKGTKGYQPARTTA